MSFLNCQLSDLEQGGDYVLRVKKDQTEAVQKDLFRHPSKLLRIIMKGGLQ